MRQRVILGLGWAATVTAAAAFGIATISALDDGTEPNTPLSAEEVRDRLSVAPSVALAPTGAPAPTSGAPKPTSAAPAARTFFTTPGGSLWASCSAGLATLESITPGSGFRLDDYDTGPGEHPEVRFKQDVQHGHAAEYAVRVTCIDGVPTLTSDD